MFSTDRDILSLEPSVFSDVAIAAQQRLSVTDGVLSGTTLTSSAADFEAAQVQAGGVVLIDDVPHEVVARVDANTLTVSLLRTDRDDPPIPSTNGANHDVVVRTFGPQIAVVHAMLLRMLGIDSDDPSCGLDAGAVLSVEVMRQLETLGTLERIYSGAVALAGDSVPALHKATEYRRRFRAALSSATVLLDLDGDGVADVRRHMGVHRLVRR